MHFKGYSFTDVNILLEVSLNMDDTCNEENRKGLIKKSSGKRAYRRILEDETPVIEIFNKKPSLSPEAVDYLEFIGKTYEDWIKEDATQIINAYEVTKLNNWVKAYENEDPRFHWMKDRVMDYFNIKTPQTFLQMAHRSGKKHLKKILHFIRRPLRKKNIHKNLWFYAVKHSINIYQIIPIEWETEVIEESSLTNLKTKSVKLVSSGSSDSSSMLQKVTVKTRGPKKKKQIEKPPSPKFNQHNAQIPVNYTKEILKIHLQCARRPLGRIIKINFIGFSRIPNKKIIPYFNKSECELEMPNFVKEIKIGRITKPDEKVFLQQCLENRPKIEQFDCIFRSYVGEGMRNNLIKSYLKVDFRTQWLKEKLLNYFEMKEPREFYKMSSRHRGIGRNSILQFLNSKYDPLDKDSCHQILFFYSSKYLRTYYKLVKTTVEKEELVPVIEIEKPPDSYEKPPEEQKPEVGKLSMKPIGTSGRGLKAKEKKVKMTKSQKKKKMRIIKVKHEVAMLTKVKKEVNQLHLHHGPILSCSTDWRKKTKVLCFVKKNNPYQSIPHFDSYEEALAEMPKYVIILNFQMNSLLSSLFHTIDLCHGFMNKHIAEPTFPPLLDENSGTSISVPNSVAERDSVVKTHLYKVPFPWKHVVNGPLRFQNYIYEQRSWPGHSETDIVMESKKITKASMPAPLNAYKASDVRKELRYSPQIPTGNTLPHRFFSIKWLLSFKQIYNFSKINERHLYDYLKTKKKVSTAALVTATGKPVCPVLRMPVFNKVIKLIKLTNIAENITIVKDFKASAVTKYVRKEKYAELKNMKMFNKDEFEASKKLNRNKNFRNYSRLPPEVILRHASRAIDGGKFSCGGNPFKMRIMKHGRMLFPLTKTNLTALKINVRRLFKNTQYPKKLCIPHWRKMLQEQMVQYKNFQKATEHIFNQKDYIKKDMEFRTILFQYLRKLYWYCREKMPRTYGPFTLYHYWKLRELITYPFIRQCFGSRTIKFMLVHYYYNNKYYYDQFNKQFPFILRVYKRTKYYCRMFKGFIFMLKNFCCCNSVEELCSVVEAFWRYIRNYWSTSHFLSYQETFCWALSYVVKTLVGKIKSIVKIESLLSSSPIEAENTLFEVLYLMKLWKDEFNKYFSLCTNDKGSYIQFLILLEDDFFQITANVSKICADLLKLLKRLRYFTNVFGPDLAGSVTVPKMVYYWREKCIESIRSIADYDIFDLENDKKWDHMQSQWHKNFKVMERHSIRLIKSIFQNIRDPALAVQCINSISEKDTSRKIYCYLLRMLENCTDEIMSDFKDRFNMYLKCGNSLHDNYVYRNEPIPTGGIMWMQRYIVILFNNLKTLISGKKILEAIKQDKDIGIKLRAALKEFKDFVSTVELLAYTQEIYIRDFILLRSMTSAAIKMKCNDAGPLLIVVSENVPNYRFKSHNNAERKPSSTQIEKFCSTLASIIKPRMTFKCLDESALQEIANDDKGYVDNNPAEVKAYFAFLDSKSTILQERITNALKNFLKGKFNTLRMLSEVQEKRILMNYNICSTFLRTGKLSLSFIPVWSLEVNTSPFTIFEISSTGKYIFIDSPHGYLDTCSHRDLQLKYQDIETPIKKKYYKYVKVISNNLASNFLQTDTRINKFKNIRYLPKIVYSAINNFNVNYKEELKLLIGNPSCETVRFHMSFLLLVFLRELLHLKELKLLMNKFGSVTRPTHLDMNTTFRGDEELFLTTSLYLSLNEEQLEKLAELRHEFEKMFLIESQVVEQMDLITDTSFYLEKEIIDNFCDDSDSSQQKTNHSLEEDIESSFDNKHFENIGAYSDSASSDRWLNIKAYKDFNSYFEDLECVPDDNFGILVKMTNLIIFKDNVFINAERLLRTTPESIDLKKNVEYDMICTVQDRRALPLKESKEVEEDWDFLTNFIFEHQGDIIRHFILKPQEFNMRIFGSDCYLDLRDVYFKTNKKGEVDLNKYPIMFDKTVQKRVCKLSDRYYSEQNEIERFMSETDSGVIDEEPTKEKHKVQLIYEPITSWNSDDSLPSDFFPQRWIDRANKDFVPFDPYGREAAQMMILFKKGSQVQSDLELTENLENEEKNESEKSHSKDIAKPVLADKKNLYEVHHNLASKNKCIFFEPIEENFLCYALHGFISDGHVDESHLKFDGGQCSNKDQLIDVFKISSNRVGRWCSKLNYYNKHKKLLPFVEKVSEWSAYNSNKIREHNSYKASSITHSQIPKFRNISNMPKYRDENYPEKIIGGFPTPGRFSKWATYWPFKKGEASLNLNGALDKIARSLFLRRKFIVPEKIRNLNSFYKYYYYKLKRNRTNREPSHDNFLFGWKTHPYFATQRRNRTIAQDNLKRFIRCPQNSGKYLDRLFTAHSLFLLRKYCRDNNLAQNIFENFNKLTGGQKNKLDKFLYGIYNKVQFDPIMDKLNYLSHSLKNESADLLKPVCSNLAKIIEVPHRPLGSIPFYIPLKYLNYICNSISHQSLSLKDKQSESCLDDIPKELDVPEEKSIQSSLQKARALESKKRKSVDARNSRLRRSVEDALRHWKDLLAEHSKGQMTLATIEERMYEILQETNYHKRCSFSIKLPSKFLVPYSQNRNMVHTLVNTDEDYTWKYDLEFTALSWRHLKQCISAYNDFLQKLENETDDDLYFMRTFLKQMDLRMVVILRSYLLYKRIPMRSKKFIENGKYMYDFTLMQLKEVLSSVINPSWDYVKDCIWLEGLHHDKPFEDYITTVMEKREEVLSNLIYNSHLFHHQFKVLHYVLHGDWPPGFVNNFRFYKYFELYERRSIQYFVKNLALHVELSKELLHGDVDQNVIEDCEKESDDVTLKSSSRLMLGSSGEFKELLWIKAGKSSRDGYFLGHPILTIAYKYGDVCFEEPVEKWLFKLWFHYVNGYINFPRWMSGTCEDAVLIKIISKESTYQSTVFDEFLKYTEPKIYLMEGVKHIISFLDSLNSYRKKWKIFYNLWSAKHRYRIRYTIIHEDLSLSKIDEVLRYITQVIERLKEISIVSFGFIKIDLNNFIHQTMIPRCEKFKSSLCYGVMKRIKNYMTAFNKAIYPLLEEGEDFKHFLVALENAPKAKMLVRDFNIGVVYAREACEVLAHSGLMFTGSFFERIHIMECTLHAARSRIKCLKLYTFYYQMHFKEFMAKFKAKCTKFATKWWNEGPRNYDHDLDIGLDLLAWYRKGFRDLKLKQMQYSLVRKKLSVYLHHHYYFENSFNDYKNVETLYAYYQIYKSYYKEWNLKNWHTFMYNEILSELEPMRVSFQSLDFSIRKSPLGEEINTLISRVYKTIMILIILKDKTVKERHWIHLMTHTNYNVDLMDPNLQLAEFFQWNLWNISNFIDKLYLQAKSEHTIIQKIKRLSYASVSLKLQILPYYDDGKLIGFILDTNEITLKFISGYLEKFEKLLLSEFSGRFSECITTWISILTFCHEVLLHWLKVQTKLLVIKPFALSGNLGDELPEVASSFAPVDREYFKMTSVFARQRGVISQSMKRGIVKKFHQFSEVLDECLGSIVHYLDTQQLLSPSFEFIDRDLILNIMEV